MLLLSVYALLFFSCNLHFYAFWKKNFGQIWKRTACFSAVNPLKSIEPKKHGFALKKSPWLFKNAVAQKCFAVNMFHREPMLICPAFLQKALKDALVWMEPTWVIGVLIDALPFIRIDLLWHEFYIFFYLLLFADICFKLGSQCTF